MTKKNIFELYDDDELEAFHRVIKDTSHRMFDAACEPFKQTINGDQEAVNLASLLAICIASQELAEFTYESAEKFLEGEGDFGKMGMTKNDFFNIAMKMTDAYFNTCQAMAAAAKAMKLH